MLSLDDQVIRIILVLMITIILITDQRCLVLSLDDQVIRIILVLMIKMIVIMLMITNYR